MIAVGVVMKQRASHFFRNPQPYCTDLGTRCRNTTPLLGAVFNCENTLSTHRPELSGHVQLRNTHSEANSAAGQPQPTHWLHDDGVCSRLGMAEGRLNCAPGSTDGRLYCAPGRLVSGSFANSPSPRVDEKNPHHPLRQARRKASEREAD